MTDKIINGILIDTESNTCKAYELHHTDYTDIVRACSCKYITCVSRDINGVCVDIYCDDEALLHSPIPPIAVITLKNGVIVEQLFGNCFICDHTNNGDVKSLTKKDIERVLKNSVVIGDRHCLVANL